MLVGLVSTVHDIDIFGIDTGRNYCGTKDIENLEQRNYQFFILNFPSIFL